MHAFLVEENPVSEQTLNQFSDLNKLEFEVSKIEDVKSLQSFLRFPPTSKTLIVINSLDKGSKEAQNSILKTIEEPPTAITFLLSVKNTEGLIPTVLSRVQIIEQKSGNNLRSSNVSSKDELVKIINAVKTKDEAIAFLEDLLANTNIDIASKRAATKAIEAVNKNANVTLTLLNFMVNSL